MIATRVVTENHLKSSKESADFGFRGSNRIIWLIMLSPRTSLFIGVLPLFAALVTALLTNAAHGVEVDEWRLTSRVNGEGLGLATDTMTEISNPFTANHSVSLQNSMANSSYSASWDDSGFLQFLVEGEHTAAGNPSFYSRSNGNITLTPTVDSILSIHAVYNYALPSGIRGADLEFSVFDTSEPLAIFFEVEGRSAPPDLPVGTINIEGEVSLLAARQYSINYRMALDCQSGNPSVVSTGNGSVSFQITPVPEPATLLLIATMFPFLHRSRR